MASSVKNHASGEVRKIQMFNHCHIISIYSYIYIYSLYLKCRITLGEDFWPGITRRSPTKQPFLRSCDGEMKFTQHDDGYIIICFLTLVVIKMHANYHSVTIKSLS